MGWVVNATSLPLYPWERPSTHCLGGWVGPRAGLEGCGKSGPPTKIRSLARPACSESLYRLSYPGSEKKHVTVDIGCPRPGNSWMPIRNVTCWVDFFGSFPVKKSRNRPGVAQRVPGGLGSQISWHSAHEGGEVSLTHRPPLPPGVFLVLILTRGWVDPRAMVRSERSLPLKNPVTTGSRSRDHPTSSASP